MSLGTFMSVITWSPRYTGIASSQDIFNRSESFTVEIGDREERLNFSPPFADNEILDLDIDYRFWANLGFEIDASASFGDVSVVAPLSLGVETEDFVVAGNDITIDTSDWRWDLGSLVAQAGQYSVDVDFVTEMLLSTVEQVEVANGLFPLVHNFNLPDAFFGVPGGEPAIVRDLFTLDSTRPEALADFSIGPVDFNLSLPAQVGVISTALTAAPNGAITAESITAPFFSGGFTLSDLLAGSPEPGFQLISQILDGDLDIPGGSSLDWTLFDIGVDVEFNLAREVVFTPTDHSLTVEDLSDSSSVQTGQLGDTFTFASAANGDDASFQMTADLEGEISQRWGIAADLVIPFELLQLQIQSASGNELSFGPLLQDQFRFNILDPVYFVELDTIPLDLGTQSLDFSVNVLTDEEVINVDPGGDPDNPDGEPTAVPELPLVSLGNAVEVVEGNVLRVPVGLDRISTAPISIGFSLTPITAEAFDFAAQEQIVTIAPGDIGAFIEIDTFQDADFDDETLRLSLLSSEGAILPSARQVNLSILDDDTPDNRPTLFATINSTVNEGEPLEFIVRLDGPAPDGGARIGFEMLRDTAEFEDILVHSGIAEIPVGASEITVSIPTVLDGDGEDERLTFRVTSLDGVSWSADTDATGRIIDTYIAPPTPPTLVGLADQSATEGDILSFRLELGQPAPSDVEVTYSVRNLTAETSDYFVIGGRVGTNTATIAQGQTGADIRIQSLNDTDSRDETFEVVITGVTGTNMPSDTSAIGTIVDAEVPTALELRVTPVDIREGNDMTMFVIDIPYNPQNRTITFNYRLESGTATEGVDFATSNIVGEASLSSDDSRVLIRVDTIDDNIAESDETVRLVIENVQGGTIDQAEHFARIVDDDQPVSNVRPELFVAGASLSQTTIDEGQELSLEFVIDNSATVRASNSETGVFLSENDVRGDSDDLLLFDVTMDIEPNEADHELRDLAIVPTLDPGTYFIFVEANHDRQITEVTTSNNVSSPLQFIVNALPDADVIALSSSATEGQTAPLRASLNRVVPETVVLEYVIRDPSGIVIDSGMMTIAAGTRQGNATFNLPDNTTFDGNTALEMEITGVAQGQANIAAATAIIAVADDEAPVFTPGPDTITLPGSVPDYTAFAAGGSDMVAGSSGPDMIFGNTGNDTLDGGGGSDTINGGAGSDVLDGGLGNDTLEGGIAGDVIDGGPGIDTAAFVTAGAGVNANLGAGMGSAGNANGDTYTDVENLLGSDHDDTLTGSTGDNLIEGGRGSDWLRGASGDDTLEGGDGDDSLLGGPGADVFVFADGFGADTVQDFTDGVDLLDVRTHTQIHDFADLDVTASGVDSLIADGFGNTIRILGSAGDIEEGDFLF